MKNYDNFKNLHLSNDIKPLFMPMIAYSANIFIDTVLTIDVTTPISFNQFILFVF